MIDALLTCKDDNSRKVHATRILFRTSLRPWNQKKRDSGEWNCDDRYNPYYPMPCGLLNYDSPKHEAQAQTQSPRSSKTEALSAK